MISLRMKDKKGQELFEGDRVQVVNGAQSGQILTQIKAAAKPFTLVGTVKGPDGKATSVEVVAKKVLKL